MTSLHQRGEFQDYEQALHELGSENFVWAPVLARFGYTLSCENSGQWVIVTPSSERIILTDFVGSPKIPSVAACKATQRYYKLADIYYNKLTDEERQHPVVSTPPTTQGPQARSETIGGTAGASKAQGQAQTDMRSPCQAQIIDVCRTADDQNQKDHDVAPSCWQEDTSKQAKGAPHMLPTATPGGPTACANTAIKIRSPRANSNPASYTAVPKLGSEVDSRECRANKITY